MAMVLNLLISFPIVPAVSFLKFDPKDIVIVIGGFMGLGYATNWNNNQQKFTPRPKQIDYVLEDVDPNSEIRLNKYMANAGICSRREADEYITAGKVKVNGEVVKELGTKISRNDVVEYDDKVVTPERKCYVLLNQGLRDDERRPQRPHHRARHRQERL
jgi:ribosomal 50S subunit-recycling heat shock protein